MIGRSLPEQDKLHVLAEWLAEEPHALRFGDEVHAQQARWYAGLKIEEREVLEAFLSLPAPQKNIIREVILAFVKAQSTV